MLFADDQAFNEEVNEGSAELRKILYRDKLTRITPFIQKMNHLTDSICEESMFGEYIKACARAR